jgi:hypothetical protein
MKSMISVSMASGVSYMTTLQARVCEEIAFSAAFSEIIATFMVDNVVTFNPMFELCFCEPEAGSLHMKSAQSNSYRE